MKSLLHLPSAYALTMKRQPGYKWWKPLVTLLLAGVFTLCFATIAYLAVSLAVVAVSLVFGVSLPVATNVSSDIYISTSEDSLMMLIATFVTVIVFIPAAGLASKLMGLGGLRGLSSVEGKLRWNRLVALFPWAMLVALAFCGIQIGLALLFEPGGLGEFRFSPAVMICILVLCPLQCAAEEYMFRGLVMQVFSSWIPKIVIPMVLQAVMFAAMHGYSVLGIVGCLITGLVVGFLTLKTGGLEASICAHTANNYVSFFMGAMFAAAETAVEVSIESFALDASLWVVFGVVLFLVAKGKGHLLSE